jgi:hypothetical protein
MCSGALSFCSLCFSRPRVSERGSRELEQNKTSTEEYHEWMCTLRISRQLFLQPSDFNIIAHSRPGLVLPTRGFVTMCFLCVREQIAITQMKFLPPLNGASFVSVRFSILFERENEVKRENKEGCCSFKYN